MKYLNFKKLNPFERKSKKEKGMTDDVDNRKQVVENISRKKKQKEEKKRKDEYFEMFKSWLGDRDYRTRQGIVNAVLVFLTLASVVVFTIILIIGGINWQQYKYSNTTPIGDELQFERSEAILDFNGVWTDKKKDVTAVRLHYDDDARKKLSTQGKNYKLYLIDSDGKAQKNVKLSYGVLAQGDGFLFIKGNLDKKAYQVLITNQSNISSDTGGGDGVDLDSGSVDLDDVESDSSSSSNLAGKSEDEITEAELEKSLSDVRQGDVSKKGRLNFGNNSSKPSVDYIDFRVNSYSDSTKVYDGSFLNKDGSIDYATIFKQSNTNSAVKSIDKKIESLESDKETNENTIEEYKERQKRAEGDDEAKSNIQSLKEKGDSIDEEIENQKMLKKQYQDYDITEKSFGDMQRKFKVLRSMEN